MSSIIDKDVFDDIECDITRSLSSLDDTREQLFNIVLRFDECEYDEEYARHALGMDPGKNINRDMQDAVDDITGEWKDAAFAINKYHRELKTRLSDMVESLDTTMIEAEDHINRARVIVSRTQ